MKNRTQAAILFDRNPAARQLGKLAAPYRNWSISSTAQQSISPYNPTQIQSELYGCIVTALDAYCKGPQSPIGIVKIANGNYASQLAQDNGDTYLAVYMTSGHLHAVIRSSNGSFEQFPTLTAKKEYDKDISSILLPIILAHADENTDAGRTLAEKLDYCKAVFNAEGIMDETSVRWISDLVVNGITYGDIPVSLPGNGIEKLTKEDLSTKSTTGQIICGNPDILMPKTKEAGNSFITMKEAKAMFSEFAGTQDWSPEEEEMICRFDDDALVRPEVIKIANRYTKSLSTKKPLNNIYWQGESSVGKSFACKMLSCILRLPYINITCDSNMEKLDFMSSFVPNTAKGNPASVNLPSMVEMYADPVTAYAEITGVEKPDATEDDALVAYAEAYARAKNTVNQSNFMFIPGDYIKGLSSGYLIEIAEPSRTKAGCLVGLNQFDKAGNTITLADGTHLTRHAKTLCVFTDNVGYRSCRPMDESVYRRFDYCLLSTDLSKEEVLKRVRYNTGCKDRRVLDGCYSVWSTLKEYCKTHEITDAGELTTAELESLVCIYAMEKDIRASVEECCINKVTSDLATRRQLWENCARNAVSTAFICA